MKTRNRIATVVIVLFCYAGIWACYQRQCNPLGGTVQDVRLMRGRYSRFVAIVQGTDRRGEPCTCSETVSFTQARDLRIGDTFNPNR